MPCKTPEQLAIFHGKELGLLDFSDKSITFPWWLLLDMGVSWNGGPPNHFFFSGIFLSKPTIYLPAIGISIFRETTNWLCFLLRRWRCWRFISLWRRPINVPWAHTFYGELRHEMRGRTPFCGDMVWQFSWDGAPTMMKRCVFEDGGAFWWTVGWATSRTISNLL